MEISESKDVKLLGKERRYKMIKRVIANKVKDGWIVEVINREHLYSKSDVIKLAKQLGLDIQKQFSNEETIIAE